MSRTLLNTHASPVSLPRCGLRGLVLLAGFVGIAAAAPRDDAPTPQSTVRLVNADDMRRKLGLSTHYAAVPRIGDIKIAVLDSGFDGIDGKRPYLPASTVVVEHYDLDFVRNHKLGDPAFQKPFLPGNIHGRLMAQIAWATAGKSPQGPKFYLLNANGPTLFRRAVKYAIEEKVDIILFSGTFEGAGNYDGRGHINVAVDEAVAAGIIWVNAAGNTGGMVYDGSVQVGPDGFLQFGKNRQSWLRFTNRLDENAITVTLTWNDYRDTEDAGTAKDLDLFVEDANGQLVSASKLKQIAEQREAGDGETKNPRERLTIPDLPAAPIGKEYRIRVKANTANFGPRDRLRVLISAARNAPVTDPQTKQTFLPVQFLDATPRYEIYPPADHAGVITVGDASPVSSVGPTADGRLKPDVVLADSVARFSNGDETVGSSNAAAYFAGVAAVLKATEPRLTASHLRAWVRMVDKHRTSGDVKTITPISPPVVVPLTPNQQRAQRYAEITIEEQRRQGVTNPKVVVSNGGAVARPTPAPAPPPDLPPQGVLVHTPWLTPAPRALAELVR